MKISSICKFSSVAGKIIMGLVLAALIGSVNVAPAVGDDRDRGGRYDNRRYEHRGHRHDRDRFEHRRYYRPYDYEYRERVYAPPPVIYAPPPPPGIGIFIPFHR